MATPLTSDELQAMAPVVGICCKNATDAYNESKRKKMHPVQTIPLREVLNGCLASVNKGLSTSCADVYQALIECKSKSKKLSACTHIEKDLEKCAVRAKLGELA